ncbi:hypothetical protein [Caldovatus aquaticus]|uniref:Uncharacterized protein n=1 Tax=Caldovatus aquaticus TaxID=2865671 RepID=A0ABS7F4F7_9PROT|nr:hypothetical protein [Caldovatus aquaticus]MBW8270497.1 hypothetical protein [Caldovatus aquaticus]
MPDDSSSEGVSIAVTPMHRAEDGLWENGPREGARFFLVEFVHGNGADAEVVVECRDERTAALAARVAAATVAALGLAAPADLLEVEAFDDQTAEILADNPTPGIAAPSGEWRSREEDPDETSP